MFRQAVQEQGKGRRWEASSLSFLLKDVAVTGGKNDVSSSSPLTASPQHAGVLESRLPFSTHLASSSWLDFSFLSGLGCSFPAPFLLFSCLSYLLSSSFSSFNFLLFLTHFSFLSGHGCLFSSSFRGFPSLSCWLAFLFIHLVLALFFSSFNVFLSLLSFPFLVGIFLFLFSSMFSIFLSPPFLISYFF